MRPGTSSIIEVSLRSFLCKRFFRRRCKPLFWALHVSCIDTVYGKKTALERAPGQFLPCVLIPPSKNFRKFCAVSPSFFFLSMTYAAGIFYVKAVLMYPRIAGFLKNDLCGGGAGSADEIGRGAAHLRADAPAGNVDLLLGQDAFVKDGHTAFSCPPGCSRPAHSR